jgi:hypothetical protein
MAELEALCTRESSKELASRALGKPNWDTQRQLLSIGPAEAPDEFFKTRRCVRKLEVAAPLQFFSDIFADIARPCLRHPELVPPARRARKLLSQREERGPTAPRCFFRSMLCFVLIRTLPVASRNR